MPIRGKIIVSLALGVALLMDTSGACADDDPRPLPQAVLDADLIGQIATVRNRLPLLEAPLLRKLLEGLRKPKAPMGVGVRILPGRLRRGSDYLVRVHCPTNANAAHVVSSVFNAVGQRYYRRTVFGFPFLVHGTGHAPSAYPVAHDLRVGVYRVELRCLRVRHNPLKAYSKRHRDVVARAETWVVVRRFKLNHF